MIQKKENVCVIYDMPDDDNLIFTGYRERNSNEKSSIQWYDEIQ